MQNIARASTRLAKLKPLLYKQILLYITILYYYILLYMFVCGVTSIT